MVFWLGFHSWLQALVRARDREVLINDKGRAWQ
jgi:hypothetical protein